MDPLNAFEQTLISALKYTARKVGDNAVVKGFRIRGRLLNLGERVSLIHAELSEVIEADRDGNPRSEKIPAFSSMEEELADTVIRCLDLADERGWSLGASIVAKMRYNATRPVMHGGKKY